MIARGRLAIGSGVVVTAVALALIATWLTGPGIADAAIIRIVLGVLAVFYGGIVLVYTLDGYGRQAFGHALVAAGFAIVAAAGHGSGAWAGVVLLAIGGAAVFTDALQQGGRGRAGT